MSARLSGANHLKCADDKNFFSAFIFFVVVDDRWLVVGELLTVENNAIFRVIAGRWKMEQEVTPGRVTSPHTRIAYITIGVTQQRDSESGVKSMLTCVVRLVGLKIDMSLMVCMHGKKSAQVSFFRWRRKFAGRCWAIFHHVLRNLVLRLCWDFFRIFLSFKTSIPILNWWKCKAWWPVWTNLVLHATL